MKKQNLCRWITPLTAGAGCLGLVLHILQRRAALGDDGLWTQNHPLSWALIGLTALVLVGLAVYCAGLEKASAFDAVRPTGQSGSVLAHLAVALLLAGGVYQMFSAGMRVSTLLLIAAALLLECCNLARQQDRRPGLFLNALAVLCIAVRLVAEFRLWSKDPSIWDYCFLLFAAVCIMLACYHMGAFSIDRGQRRRTMFFCLAGIYCSIVSIPDGGPAQVMIGIGFALLLYAYASGLARRRTTQ